MEKNARHRGAENVKNARYRGTGACATSLLVFVTRVAELTSLLLPLLSTMHQHYIATLLIQQYIHYITLQHCSTNKQYIHWKTHCILLHHIALKFYIAFHTFLNYEQMLTNSV